MNQFIDFDEKLYAGLRQGDEAAFTVVFERYNRLLYALAYRYLKSGEEAEDAVQYTFMKCGDSAILLIFGPALGVCCSPFLKTIY